MVATGAAQSSTSGDGELHRERTEALRTIWGLRSCAHQRQGSLATANLVSPAALASNPRTCVASAKAFDSSAHAFAETSRSTALRATVRAYGLRRQHGCQALLRVPGVVYAGEARMAKDIAKHRQPKAKQQHEEQKNKGEETLSRWPRGLLNTHITTCRVQIITVVIPSRANQLPSKGRKGGQMGET